MEGNARPRFTPKQRAEVWGERWRNGQCIADIAQALERRNKSGVYRVLALNGGLPQQHAGERRSHWRWRSVRRCRARLPRVDRYAGSRRGSHAHPRELKRHGGGSAYRATEADTRAWELTQRPKPCGLAAHP
jgi:hypothetical protein